MSLSPAVARRNERVMAVVVFVVFTGFAFVIPFLPLYVRELGVEDDSGAALWSGALISVSPLLAGLLSPLWGRLADRYGHKVMATRALIAYVVLLAMSAVVTSVEQLFVLRVGVGLFGGIGPLATVMATASAEKGQAGRAIGLMQAAQILAAAVGPFAGGLLAGLIGMRATFVVTAALCAIALGLLLRYYEVPPSFDEDPQRARNRGGVALLPLLPVLVVLFVVNFVSRSFTPVLPLQVERLGVDPVRVPLATGLLISCYSIAAAISAAGLGRLARTHAPRRLLLGSLVTAALLFAPIAWAPSFGILLVLAGALGLSFGGALTLGYTLGDGVAPSDRRGAAFGWFTGVALFGGAVSPLVAGTLVRWDLRGIYYVDMVLFAALAAGIALAAPRVRPVARPAD
jgi:MFS transporter, DHA1 family, multidrug resistance protein